MGWTLCPAGSVVGHEDHDRVAVQAQFVEALQETSDIVVDVGDHAVHARCRVVQTLLRVGQTVRVGHLEWRVWGVVGHVGEERTVTVALDEIERAVGEDVGTVALRADQAPVVQDERIEVARAVRRIGRLTEAAPANHHGLVEALVARIERVVVAQMPLAEDARVVPRILQPLGQRHFVLVHQRPAEERVHDARAVVVTPRQQACARR
jgi:hypothetical protein